jgi:hypothetical protein
VGLLREQNDHAPAELLGRAREGAVGVAGDRKVMDIVHELARKINRSHAFRAIAGPAE